MIYNCTAVVTISHCFETLKCRSVSVRNSAGQRCIGSFLITTLCDFSFREPVVRIKLIFYQHLSDFFFQSKIFMTINTNKRPILFGHCVYREMQPLGMDVYVIGNLHNVKLCVKWRWNIGRRYKPTVRYLTEIKC
jgi:hypothetical protein